MKLHYDGSLPHQRAAIDAVLRAFEGAQPGSTLRVEMETGVGKTYTFVRTALRLAAQHGCRHFVVVVPSLAIREGVVATLNGAREHFAQLFPQLRYRAFAHRRAQLHQLARYVRSSVVEFAVLTVDAFAREANVLRQPHDAFGGQTPLQSVAACAPVVIVDEPHRMRSQLRRAALQQLRPRVLLEYGATLAVGTQPGELVHRLGPARAHALGLVKTVVVHDAYAESNAARIEAVVARHLERQVVLRARGIKVLSLFFVDRVADYADTDGWVRMCFDQAYSRLHGRDPHAVAAPQAVRAAYFAQKGRQSIDSKSGSSAADAAVYTLILRDKPRLLSLDESVAFVFSHSALREGWDNPNVFQLCTLARSQSAIKKRQELGRGLRLCVDQHGRRVTDPAVNVLDVFVNESYRSFARDLQSSDADTSTPLRGPGASTVRATSFRARVVLAPGWLPRAAQRLRTFVPDRRGSEGDALDRAVARLRGNAPSIAIRRATVRAVLDRSGHAAAVLADPVRGSKAWAEAIVAELVVRPDPLAAAQPDIDGE